MANPITASVIILYSIVTSNPFVASTHTNEEIFDLSLDQVLAHPDLKPTLDTFLDKCNRVHNKETFLKTTQNDDDDEVSFYKSPCAKAQLIDRILRYEDEINNPNTVDEEEEGKKNSINIESRSDIDFSFVDFFLDFEVKGKPVKITDLPLLVPISSLSSLSMNEIVHWFQLPQLTGNFIFQGLDKTMAFVPDLKVPKYVMNDYFQRMSWNNTTDKRSVCHDSPQLTVIGSLDVIKPSDATCPSSLHGLYVILNEQEPNNNEDAAIPSRVTAKVFNPKATAKILKPKLEIKSSNKEATMPNNYRIKYDQEDELWKEDSYQEEEEEEEGMKQVDLSGQSALFVPSKSTVTFKGVATATRANNADMITLMLRFCFADASNIQSVKKSVSFDASLLDDDDSSSNPTMSKIVMLHLNNPKFDYTMIRTIPSLSNYWDNYKIWPRRNDKDDDNQSSNNGEGKKTDNHRRVQQQQQRKKKRTSKSFSNWQSEKTWNHKVLSLTLPILSPPEIVSIGRNNVTLRWASNFHKKDGDVSNIGYIVSWEGNNTNNNGIELVGNCTFYEEEDEDNSSMRIEYATDGTSLYPIKKMTVRIEGFEANTKYNFQVCMIYGTEEIHTQSLISSKSRMIHTLKPQKPLPVSSPPYIIMRLKKNQNTNSSDESTTYSSTSTRIVLEFRAPYDDGGMKLSGYDVMKSNLDSYGHKVGEWVLLQHGVEEIYNEYNTNKVGGGGQIVQVAIHNLLPGASYSFKVAARNHLGRSEWSSTSQLIDDNNNDDQVVSSRRLVGVKGTHSRTSTATNTNMIIHGIGSNSLNTPFNHKSTSTIVKLNDAQQRMTIVGMPEDIEIWSSYWSPKGFIVNAEACFIERTAEDNNDIITSHVEYRIAFIQRGMYSNSKKNNNQKQQKPLVDRSLVLQRAGALAIVIMDDENDDGSGTANTRCEYLDQYCMLGSSKSDGDNWAEYDLFSVWKDISVPVVLVRTDVGTTSEWKSILFQTRKQMSR